jgi:hypothetical protein
LRKRIVLALSLTRPGKTKTVRLPTKNNLRVQCKSIERGPGIPHLSGGMTYKEFYAQAMLSSLPIAYAVEKDLAQGREPTPESVALGASQLAMALTELLAGTAENVPGANNQY